MATKGNKVFISYRRDDAADAAGRIRDWLVQTRRSTRDDTFMDVTPILPGTDFLQVIGTAISQCKAVIVVISPSWLTQVNSPDPSYVRLEAETALRHNIPVIPVLVGGAQMPPAERLPESLRPLTRRNARPVRTESFASDMDWVRRALGLGASLRARWVAAIAALLLTTPGLALLSQTPEGNPVWVVTHPATATPAAVTYVPFTAADEAYRFHYPLGWRVDDNIGSFGGTTDTVCDKPGTSQIVDILVTAPAYTVPSDTYSALLMNVSPGFTYGSPAQTTIGANTWELSQGFPRGDPQSLNSDSAYAYAITHQGRSYLILIAAPQGTPGAMQDIYQAILASFTFLT
jgi:TIR domain